MTSAYSYPTLLPRGPSAYPVSSGDSVTMRECLFIVIFAILLAGAYWLHKSGNTYVGMALVGVPFVAVCTIQPLVGLNAY